MKNIPVATYRLQFHSGFTFQSARKIIAYLNDLGISHIYASPVFKAVKGSTHGYDVVDPAKINPELGSKNDFEKLTGDLRKRSMGWIQDIVPNHMAFHGDNHWLMDVLEKGKHSAYEQFFDIEWKDTYQDLKGKVLAPFLGRFYSQCLEDQKIQIKHDQNGLSVNYYDLRLPLAIHTYPDILFLNLKSLKLKSRPISRYRGLRKQFQQLSAKKGPAFDEHVLKIKSELSELYRKDKTIRRFLDQNIKLLNGRKGDPCSFQLLDMLLDRQLFRLAFWKFGAEEINYRRFFNINQLISLRIENTEVFERTHRLVLDWLRQGKISGLRIDHIDGLYDPKQYLQTLRNKLGNPYIVAEKILELNEQLPGEWPIDGTTGYDFLNYVNGLFVQTKNDEKFHKIYAQLIYNNILFDELVSSKKRLIIGKHMAGDIDNLAHHMKRISHKDRYGRDIALYGLKRALVEVLTFFPRYRTYIDSAVINPSDRSVIARTIARSKEMNPELVYELDFIADILLLNFKEHLTERGKRNWLHFVKRFQQFTGPLMAKGFEDTTLYVYSKLLSLNNVGGSPDKFGISPTEFHDFNLNRVRHWPNTMNSTATHDAKRGEDSRARISVLSEIPDEWCAKVKTWQKMNLSKKTTLKKVLAPDKNDEYFIYQTLIGGFPADLRELKNFKQRFKDYMIKAVREAKVHTAWIKPDARYEKACLTFIDRILSLSRDNLFLRDLLPFQENVTSGGIYNSLGQTLIKLTSPGVPDLYQGAELWDLSFVDPDNRKPVNFKKRLAMLKDIKKKNEKNVSSLILELFKTREDGRIKLFLIWKILQFRNQCPALFERGRYIPLKITGKFKNSIVGFAREYAGDHAVTVVPRFTASFIQAGRFPPGKTWEDTRIVLPGRIKVLKWRDVISEQTIQGGGAISIQSILKNFPVAFLTDQRLK